MSTNRQLYEADCRSANSNYVQTVAAAATTAEESINAQTVNAGSPSGRGVSAAADIQIRAANASYVQTKIKACHDAQVKITNSRASNLQQNGDTAAG
jgi:hypothetical protein